MIEFDVAVLGEWHLALCSAVSLSHSGRTTLVKTLHGPSVPMAGAPPSPVREPYFDDYVAEGRTRETLFHSGQWTGWQAQTWWLAVDTPVDDRDVPDTQPLLQVLEEGFARASARPTLLIVSSQVPLGFCRELQTRFGVPVAYVPENLRLGHGIDTFLRADRTVIGADLPVTAALVQTLMKGFTTEFLLTNLASAEMVKHATNVFLGMSISYANEMARMGMKFGVDNAFVTSALKADKRIGPLAYVKPGLGFAGGTLPRDLRVLQALGHKLSVPVPIVEAVLAVNEQVDDVIIERIVQFGPAAKKVVLMGYSYKADVDTVRRSPAERLAKRLKAQGFAVFGVDPMMTGKDLGTLTEVLTALPSLSARPDDCELFVVVTPRAEFKTMTWPAPTSKRSTVFDLHEAFKLTERPPGYAWMELWK